MNLRPLRECKKGLEKLEKLSKKALYYFAESFTLGWNIFSMRGPLFILPPKGLSVNIVGNFKVHKKSGFY